MIQKYFEVLQESFKKPGLVLESFTSCHISFVVIQGLTFDWPEVVPFRLTHNMVSAMGPLGYEGIFRKSAEATLRVMTQVGSPLQMSLTQPHFTPV